MNNTQNRYVYASFGGVFLYYEGRVGIFIFVTCATQYENHLLMIFEESQE